MPEDYLSQLDKDFKEVLNSIYKTGEADISKNNQILATQGKLLAETVNKNFQIDFKTPDYGMLERLTSDVWRFSAAKNYHELKDLTSALKDENGKIRSFSDFQEVASKINDKFNKDWLRTEYNQAISGATSAARWSDFEKNSDIMPNLEYQTAGDDFVRMEHALLNGIIKPMNDSFWDSNYPPNGWNCRCEAIQIPNSLGYVTPPSETPEIHIPEMFRTNLAKTGLIFPKGSAYYSGIPKSELRRAIAYLPPKNVYQEFNIGKYVVLVHPLHGKNELTENLKAVNAYLDKKPKANIKLLPILNEKDMAAKKLYLSKEYLSQFPNKSPDILLNGKPVDIKNINGSYASVQHGIAKGVQQANEVILYINADNIATEINRAVIGELKKESYQNKHLTVKLLANKDLKTYKIK
ncbi:MAG: minor capsid protein [Bacteroidales bacterium]|nr:minor capsid protein [Bacteroidales bacterium]